MFLFLKLFFFHFSSVHLDLLAKLLKHQLMEQVYDALVAQLELSIHYYDRGLVIKVSGFNHKLHVSKIKNYRRL